MNRKSASPLWAGPRLLSNRTSARARCAAIETPRFGRSLAIGAVVVLLRLSALGMIGASGRAIRTDSSIPSKGRQAKLDKMPATDQIPEGFSCSVAPHHQKPDKDQLDKGFQNHGFWRPFGYFSGEGKVPRGLGPGRPHKYRGAGGGPRKGVQSVPLWKTIQTAVWAAAPASAPGDRSTSPGAAWAIHPGASPPAGRPRPPRRWSSRWAGR